MRPQSLDGEFSSRMKNNANPKWKENNLNSLEILPFLERSSNCKVFESTPSPICAKWSISEERFDCY